MKTFKTVLFASVFSLTSLGLAHAEIPKVNGPDDPYPSLYESKSAPYIDHVQCNSIDTKRTCDFDFKKDEVPEVASTSSIFSLLKGKRIVHIWNYTSYQMIRSSGIDDTIFFLDDRGHLFKHTYVSSAQYNEAIMQAEKSGAKITTWHHWYSYPFGIFVSLSTIISLTFPFILGFFILSMLGKFFYSPAKSVNAKSMPSFDDIAGNEYAIGEMKSLAHAFIKGPSHPKYALVPTGILLTGPPGNGKTMMASALAREIRGRFLSVNGADFVEMFAGMGPRRVSNTFREARKRGDCILFIDEIDAIGRNRNKAGNDSASQEWVNTLNKLLTSIDGIENKKGRQGILRRLFSAIRFRRRGRIIVVGATNRPDDLDPALIRSGRLEKKIHVPNPDGRVREGIARLHMRKRMVSDTFDFGVLARSTAGMSGADIEFLCKESEIARLHRGLDVITMDCFNDALDLKLLGQKTGASMPRDVMHTTAIHEGGHAMIAINRFSTGYVRRITIEPRGNALGFVAMVPMSDRYSESLYELRSMLMVQVAGRVAQAIVFGMDKITTGAYGDITQATSLARRMVMKFGLCETVGMIEIGDNTIENPVSDSTRQKVDEAVKTEIDNAIHEVSIILKRNVDGLNALAMSLLDRNTQTGKDVAEYMLEADIGQNEIEDVVDTGTHEYPDAGISEYMMEKGIIQ